MHNMYDTVVPVKITDLTPKGSLFRQLDRNRIFAEW